MAEILWWVDTLDTTDKSWNWLNQAVSLKVDDTKKRVSGYVPIRNFTDISRLWENYKPNPWLFWDVV
jgi:hypothetical protein